MKTISERASAYLARLPVSVSGQGGHGAAFTAALALIKGFSLSKEEALPLLEQWNQACLPPWSLPELRHKLDSAASSPTPDGYLLGKAPPCASHPANGLACQRCRSHSTACAHPPEGDAAHPPSEEERRERLRLDWPKMLLLDKEEIGAIATLRGLPRHAVDLIHQRGLLRNVWFGEYGCFILHEGRFAQARRYDGRPFVNAEGRTSKTKNLPGSEGAFFGRSLLGRAPHVLLVEGAIRVIEAAAAFYSQHLQNWTVLAATSASSRFARDPALLHALADRHVRILPDADEAGLNAAASWTADLRSVGARVDVMELPAGHKDLGSLVCDLEGNRETLSTLFQ